jgi:hypothetical protein
VPNLTYEEVKELYRQYQEESGQKIEPAVVEQVYESTKGQPGLVSWFISCFGNFAPRISRNHRAEFRELRSADFPKQLNKINVLSLT